MRVVDLSVPSKDIYLGECRELPHWTIIAVWGATAWRYWVHPERDGCAIATISPHIYPTAEAALDAGEEWTVLEEHRREKAARVQRVATERKR